MKPNVAPAQPLPVTTALESIQYQSTKVRDELIAIIRDMQFVSSSEFYSEVEEEVEVETDEGIFVQGKVTRNSVNENSLRSHEMRIESLLKDAFKINVNFKLGLYPASVGIHDAYVNNVMYNAKRKKLIHEHSQFIERFIAGKEKGVRGAVNLKTATLSGVFSEWPITIYMPVGQFTRYPGIPKSWKWTPEEAASIVLHEVGHYFAYCEYFSRTVRTNQALAQLSRDLLGSYSAEKREIAITTCKNSLNLRDLDPKALAGNSNSTVIEVSIVAEAIEQTRSELGCNIYDNTSFEYLSDMFAVRMGGGRASMTAQVKLDKMFGTTTSYDTTPAFILRQTLTMLAFLVPPVAIVIMFGALDEAGDNTYDTTEARLRRIRNDMLGMLRSPHIGKEAKEQLIDDLNAADEMLKGVRDRRSWATTIADTIIPKYRKYRKTMQLQKQLEQIANNSLFLRAAELSTLK